MGSRERWIFGYRDPVMRFGSTVVLAVLSGVFAVTLVTSAVTGDPPFAFEVVCLVALSWNVFWALWYCGYSMEVDGTRVTWRAVLRTREVELVDIAGNRRFGFGFAERFRVRDAPSLVLSHQVKGWHEFLNATDGRHPSHPFTESKHRLFASGPLANRWRSGFYERWE